MSEDKKVRPIDLFVDNVSVAGLQEAFAKNAEPYQKYLFRLTLILATTAAAYQSYTIGFKYLVDDTRFFTDHDQIGKRMPFPNVTICGPEAFKGSVIRKLIMGHTDEKKRQIDIDDLVDKMKTLLSYSLRERARLGKLDKKILKIADNYTRIRAHGVLDVYAEIYPSCTDMFHDCIFGSVRFNCCDVAELLLYDERICYHFGLDKIHEKLSNSQHDETSDPIHIDQSGFSVHALIDWPDVIFHDDLAGDGFDMFLGALPSPWDNPTAIPADMDALVMLAPPTRLRELSDCIHRTDHLPIMKFASYYDPYGVGCICENLANGLLEKYGCTLPGLNFASRNGTWMCTVEQLLGLVSVLNGQVFKTVNTNLVTAPPENLVRDGGQSAFKQCRQFCTRYIYRIISASYSALLHKNRSRVWPSPSERSDVSWSQIRIFFPTASYTEHAEQLISPAYMAVCEIGGMIGVYAGLSMVAVIEIFAYSVWACVLWKRSRMSVVPSQR